MSEGRNNTQAQHPNVLLITADQWRGDCLSAAGHLQVKTPNLDRLAERGVLFKNHFANAAPCSPARACLYTGLYQMNNRVCMNGSPLDSRHDTLAKSFRRLGYEPTLFGYTDQTEDPRSAHKNDPALRTYEGVLPGFYARARVTEDQMLWRSWLQQQGYDHVLTGEAADLHVPATGVDDPPSGKAPVYKAEHTDTAFLVGEFTRWLSEQQVESSEAESLSTGWFAHMSFLRPHPPFAVPAPFNDMYNADDIQPFKGEGNSATEHPFLSYTRSRAAKSSFIPGAKGLVSDWSNDDLRRIAAIYYGMCTEVDAQIGLLLDALEAANQLDNTVIVFTSDHGEQLGDHAFLGKFGFYDSSYHIPLIISDPATTRSHGCVVDAFTEAVDVMPTLLNIAGGQAPAQLDGRSLLPLINGDNKLAWRNSVHWEYDFRDVAARTAEQHFGIESQVCNLSVMRSRQYKYVHFAALPSLLFDLEADPHETRNLMNEPAYHSVAIDCAEELLSWRARHLDQSLALSRVSNQGLVSSH